MILLGACISVNIGLGVFNLIPLPPLDGSKIVGGFLPYNARNWFDKYYNIFYIAFIVIWVTGLAGRIISPIISVIYNGIFRLVMMLFGITII